MGAMKERLGLLILALGTVKYCQVLEISSYFRMIRSIYLLVNR